MLEMLLSYFCGKSDGNVYILRNNIYIINCAIKCRQCDMSYYTLTSEGFFDHCQINHGEFCLRAFDQGVID